MLPMPKKGEPSANVVDPCREYGTSNASYYWKAKYVGMTVSDSRRPKALEAENRRLKQIAA